MSKQPPSDDAVRLMHRLRTYAEKLEFATARVRSAFASVHGKHPVPSELAQALIEMCAPAERPAPEGQPGDHGLEGGNMQPRSAHIRKSREIVNDLVDRCGASLSSEEQAILVDDFSNALELASRGWRSIESVRKDGTKVDLWVGNRRYADCQWSQGAWLVELPTTRGEFIRMSNFEPTHWQPVPEPPES